MEDIIKTKRKNVRIEQKKVKTIQIKTESKKILEMIIMKKKVMKKTFMRMKIMKKKVIDKISSFLIIKFMIAIFGIGACKCKLEFCRKHLNKTLKINVQI